MVEILLTLEVAMPHSLAGQPAPRELLTNIPGLVSTYYTEQPDPKETMQQVAFGTSGHRGACDRSQLFHPGQKR